MASNLGECFAGSWFSGLPLLSQTRLEVNDSADDVDPESQGSSQPGGGGVHTGLRPVVANLSNLHKPIRQKLL